MSHVDLGALLNSSSVNIDSVSDVYVYRFVFAIRVCLRYRWRTPPNKGGIFILENRTCGPKYVVSSTQQHAPAPAPCAHPAPTWSSVSWQLLDTTTFQTLPSKRGWTRFINVISYYNWKQPSRVLSQKKNCVQRLGMYSLRVVLTISPLFSFLLLSDATICS